MLLVRAAAAVLFSVALLAPQARAQGNKFESPGDPKAGDKSMSVQIGLFEMDDSGDGNPFLDESLTVVEGIVIYDQQLNDRLGITTELSYDHVSSASIDRLSNFPDQSGASGDFYIGADVGFRYAYTDRVDLGWHLGGSAEYDYTSIGLGGSISVEAEDKNSSWTYSLETFSDNIDVIRFDGTEESGDNRFSLAGTVSHYRVINPTTHADIGFTLSNQSGFLETPYNAVVLEDPMLPPNPNLENNARGTEITEELPDTRTRGALFGRIRHSLKPGSSVELGGRLYADSWGVTSVSLEPRYYRAISDRVRMRLGYRFYTQTEADDFGEEFLASDPTPDERTQDSDLADFYSNTFGTRFDWGTSSSSSWSLGLDYVLRSDGLDQLLVAVGWHKSF